jgi:uncharacterized membrane protein
MVEGSQQVEESFTMMDWYDNDMGASGWVFMIAAMTIFCGLVILAGVMIFRGNSGRRGGPGRQDFGALEILDDCFAWGEIDREDCEGRKSALKAGAR